MLRYHPIELFVLDLHYFSSLFLCIHQSILQLALCTDVRFQPGSSTVKQKTYQTSSPFITFVLNFFVNFCACASLDRNDNYKFLHTTAMVQICPP